MGLIKQSTIEQVFSSSDIVDVIGSFVTDLKRSGDAFKAKSPFQKEKTASFYVLPKKGRYGIFKCFSSGKGGNVVTFLMEHENMTYPQAIRWLAQRYSIPVEEERGAEALSPADRKRESLLQLQEVACRYYEDAFWEGSEDESSIGKAYMELRGFGDEILKKFRVGYAPDSWNGVIKWAKSQGLEEENIIESGVSTVSQLHDAQFVNKDFEKRKHYDTFRDRLMFPFMDHLSGRIIAFGGRVREKLPNIPKYLNSRESLTFKKKNTFYGFFLAKNSIRKLQKAYLLEGYLDIMAHHQAGIENTIGASGTAISEKQAKILSEMAPGHGDSQRITVVVIFDGDRAGYKAAYNAIDTFLKFNVNLKLVMLPEGLDPQAFISTKGAKAYQEYIDANEIDFIHFKAKYLFKDKENLSAREYAFFVRVLVKTLVMVNDVVARERYLSEVAELTDISKETLQQVMKEYLAERYQKGIKKGYIRPKPGESKPREGFKPQAGKFDESLDIAVARLIMLFPGRTLDNHMNMTDYLLSVMEEIQLELEDPEVQKMLVEIHQMRYNNEIPTAEGLIDRDPELAELVKSVTSDKFELRMDLKPMRVSPILEVNHLRRSVLQKLIASIKIKMKQLDGVELKKMEALLDDYQKVEREHKIAAQSKS